MNNDIHYQLEFLKKKLSDTPKTINGKWNSRWFSLEKKIKAIQNKIASDNWNKFLSK